jgi:hypothetical protein
VLSASALVVLAGALVLPPAAAWAKPVSKANLKALTKSINQAKHLTFAATYTSFNGGQTAIVTIAQKPPKSNFSSSGGQVINDGKNTYYCSTSGGQTGGSGNSGSSTNSGSSGNGNTGSGKSTCISVKGSNPLLGIEDAYSSTAALNAFAQARQGLVSRLLGIKVSSSSATFAGQPSTCVTVTIRGHSAKYCVTKQGILAYSGTGSDYFELTKYSSNPSAGLFSLPAGATTQSVPSIP